MVQLTYDPHRYDNNVSPIKRRNIDVANWGEEYMIKHFIKQGHDAKKSENNAVDLVVRFSDNSLGAFEVKTHKGTLTRLDNSGSPFECLHLEDRDLAAYVDYYNKTNIPVNIIWIQMMTGKVYGQKLARLLENQTFRDVTFPQVGIFPDKKTFAVECFFEIKEARLTAKDLNDLHKIACIEKPPSTFEQHHGNNLKDYSRRPPFYSTTPTFPSDDGR